MLSIMIPCLNEENNLENTVSDIIQVANETETQLDIIIVDDGSTDKTGFLISELTRKYNFIRGIFNKTNIGIGESLKKAIKIVKYEKFTIIGGSNDMSINLLRELFRYKNKAELVFGFYLNKKVRCRRRIVLSNFYNLIYTVLFDIYIQYINSPCIYPTWKLRGLPIRAQRFSVIAEITVKLLRQGCSFFEIPGYAQAKKQNSSAIKIKNLVEVINTFFMLIIEIFLTQRSLYNKKPVRVY